MRLKLLACGMLRREILALLPESPHQIDAEFLTQRLHVLDKNRRKQYFTDALASVCEECFDAVLLGYALCGGSVSGLVAHSIPLVLPRAHDCITLLLGSRKRYHDYFFSDGGTYFLASGWSEQEEALEKNLLRSKEIMTHYTRMAWIDTGIESDRQGMLRTEKIAERQHWAWEKLTGDLSLLRRLLNGDWNDDFLIVPPGKQICPTYDDHIFEIAETFSHTKREDCLNVEGLIQNPAILRCANV